MMQRFREWFARFMYGRYGSDSLNRFISMLSLAALIIGTFAHVRALYWVGVVLLGICYFRMLSYNREKRYAENMLYYRKTQAVREWWVKQKELLLQRKTHRFFRCPRCHQQLRVPRGRGKIEITCPKCKAQFIKKS